MKKLFLILFVYAFGSCANATWAQGISLPPTKSFTVQGKVKTPLTINDIDLKDFERHNIGTFTVLDENGVVRKKIKDVAGVLLKEVLGKLEPDVDNPAQVSELYLVCTSIDNYKAVYSWNEIFNSPMGNSIFLVVHKGNVSMDLSSESMLLISTRDRKTGIRYLKNLQTIHVRRAE